ncbi:MAG: heat-inducible transcription repressor HrcA [Synergistetes bacterium HGW-Synergistetes-2]|nr:MAG: heat-inducible transcription repressor HrcA [Synergistetes bacterium HGW-Synergistetes-2]
MLTERQLEVVFSVVYEYIQTGEPAGSRTISKKYLRGCSPATIRNEMADLEEMGYFYQPHTSAGRQPTSKAYRLYVDAIIQRRRTAPAETEKWKREIGERKQGIESILTYVSRLLGQATNYVGVAALSALEEVQIQRVSFLRLGGNTVLLLIVLEGGLVHHSNIQLPCELSQDMLDELGRRITTIAEGHSWSEVRDVLFRYVLEGLERVWDTCREAIVQMDALLNRRSSRLFIGGAQHILSLPDFQDIGKFQTVLSLLEQEQALAEMVERYSVKQGVSVTIGDENTEEDMKQLSLVLVPASGQSRRAILGLIGPLRMDYEKSIAILETLAEDLDDMLVQ